MGRIIRRAKLRRPPAGEALALIAAGEESELFRVCFSYRAQPIGSGGERLFPLDFAELARAALAHTDQWLGQATGGIMLLDAGRPFTTDDPLIHRVIAVAIDIGNSAVFEVNPDPTAAGAHVAGRRFDIVPCLGRQSDGGFNGHENPFQRCKWDQSAS